MLGHILLKTLESYNSFEIFNISRKKRINNSTIICDALEFNKLEKVIKKISPDLIINCIGLLVDKSNNDPKNAILTNSYLPHFLASISDKYGFQMIHISTDCVFSGKDGNYDENSMKDAIDIYGISKGLGEVNSEKHLTIRTSIIGPELKEQSEGLFEWLMSKKGKLIDGYNMSMWSGVTTLVLSRAIVYCIKKNIRGLLHISRDKISKYDLLCLINEIFNLNIEINDVEGKKSDKSLLSIRNDFKFDVPSYSDMIREMYDYMNKK